MDTLLRVLIIEDSEEDTLLIVRELKRGGFDPIHERVETPEAMTAALESQSWDIVIADYVMPHFSGLEALKLLKASGLDLPFIIVSGSIGEDVAVEAMKAGAQDYLMKNNLTRLVPAIQQELREAEVRQNLMVSQNALQQSEKRYRQVIENATEIIYSLDTKGNFTYGNPAGLKVTGFSLEELQRFNYQDVVVPEHRERVMEIYINQFSQRIPTTHVEFPFFSKAGKIIWFSQNSSLVIEDGKVVGFHIIARDITERKQAEEALRESEEKYRLLVENANEAIFVIQDGMLRFFNIKNIELIGYSKEELTSTPFINFVHPDDREVTIGRYLKRIRGEELPGVNVFRVIDKAGNIKWAEVNSVLISWEGRPATLNFLNDITERKRVEENLKQSEENARQLAQENAIMAEVGRIISSTLDIDEVYEGFSAEVKKIIPFDRIVIDIIDTEKNTVRNVYMAGKGLQDRNVKDIYPLEGSGNAEMVRTKSTLLIQTEDFDEYKDRFPMLLSTFQAGFRSIMNIPLFSKGKIIGGLLLRSHKPYAYTDKDVRLAERIASQIAGAVANAQLYAERIHAEEERVALQDQLRQSQKMEAIGTLAGGIAHDFNNLLTIIKGNSQLSLMELKAGDPLRENIEAVEKAADRAAALTRQLLAFSRRQVLEMRVLDLNTILRDLEKMLRRVIGEDVELVTFMAEDLGNVKADPGQMEQVMMNLAVNARDAMQKGGKLTIETANVELDENYAHNHIAVKPGPYVMLSVSDTGVGMTPEVRDRVFEPFFTTKEKGKGTGLGLSTVYGIVKQSGGNIWVYSEPGQGTAFKIYLPRVDELPEEAGEKVVQKELPGGGETILVVEDEEKVRQVTVKILTKNGYTVLEASHGDEARQICEQHGGPIHLILTDVVMPGMSGRELAESLVSRYPGAKVLYMSGYTDNAIVHHGVLEKGLSFLQKPFNLEGLLRKVREVLDK